MAPLLPNDRASAAAPRPWRQVWIPSAGLLTGHLAHGFSWILLAVLASRSLLTFSFPGLAWIHLVALGWLTLVSLSVLVHVIPGFLGVTWRGQAIARWSLLPFGLGALGMVASFWLGRLDTLASSASLVILALAAYLGAAGATLCAFRPPEVADRRLKRGFVFVLTMLALTAGFGVAMAHGLAHGAPAWLLTAGMTIHAHLGAVGWLSILVFGVSVRTVRPITGGGSPWPRLHALTAIAVTAGLALLVTGLAVESTWLPAVGAFVILVGALAYLIDIAAIVRRAVVPHRPPQAFLVAAAGHFAVTAALGCAVALGRSDLQPVYAFVGLIGWLGQMVNGHLHHIGIRVLATMVLGDDDETRPKDLLHPALSWAAWSAFQAAVWAVAIGLLAGLPGLVQGAAWLGFGGWLVMTANVVGAWRNAYRRLQGS